MEIATGSQLFGSMELQIWLDMNTTDATSLHKETAEKNYCGKLFKLSSSS